MLPTPVEPYVRLFGLARATAINSFRLAAGTFKLPISTSGPTASRLIGVMPFTGS